MNVSNVSMSAQTYRADDQRLRDGKGRLFSSKASSDSNRRIDLNPGISTENNMVVSVDFDVPVGTDVSQYVLVVHGSPDSVAVPVRLHQGGA